MPFLVSWYPSISKFNPTSLAIPLRSPVYPFVQPVSVHTGVPLICVLSPFLQFYMLSLGSLIYISVFNQLPPLGKAPIYVSSAASDSAPFEKNKNHLEFRSFYSNFPLTPQFQTLKHQNDRVKYRVNMH